MTTSIRCHFHGKVLIPEEPVDWPVGQTFTVDLRPGVVIVDPPSGKRSTVGDLLKSGLVGSWADRTEITDSVEYARELRRRAEQRGGADR